MKLLVNENSKKSNLAISKANDAAGVINSNLLGHIKALGIEITNEVVQDLFKNTGKTKKLYIETVKADLVNIKNLAIREGMQFQAESAWNSFENSFAQIRNVVGGDYAHLTISVDGLAVLSGGAIDVIRESHRRYVSSLEEIEAHTLLSEIAVKLNLLFKGNAPLAWHALFSKDEEGNFSTNEEIDYSTFV